MEFSVTVEHLSKSYGDVKAVNDISFSVKKGSLFAFLGVNGAGKSTTINIICSILKKDAGKVMVCGHDLDTQTELIKNEIGIVFQSSVLDKQLTVWENLDVRASFYGLSHAEKKRNVEEIIEVLRPHVRDISFSTYYRLRKEAVESLSAVLWGFTAKETLETLEKFLPSED